MTVTTDRGLGTGFFAVRRHRSAVALLIGAAVMLLVQAKAIPFYFTPFIIGMTYIGAAAAAGRRGAFWAPGIVTTCWGLAVLSGKYGIWTSDSKVRFAIAGLVGVAIALALRFTIGLAAGFVGLVVAFGIIMIHDYAPVPGWVFNGAVFTALLGIWGLWELRPATTKSVEGHGPRLETNVPDDAGHRTRVTSR